MQKNLTVYIDRVTILQPLRTHSDNVYIYHYTFQNGSAFISSLTHSQAVLTASSLFDLFFLQSFTIVDNISSKYLHPITC